MAEHLDLLIQFLEAHKELIDVGEAPLLGAHHSDDPNLALNKEAVMRGNQFPAHLLICEINCQLQVCCIKLRKIS